MTATKTAAPHRRQGKARPKTAAWRKKNRFCKAYGLALPRGYKREARKEYLKFAKAKKHTRQRIWKALSKQLSYVSRDIKYLERFMEDGYAPKAAEIKLILTIFKLYEQQK